MANLGAEVIKIKQQKRTSGCRIWLAILGFTLLLATCIIGMMFMSGVTEGTWFVPGDAANFEPLTALEEVQNFAGDDVQLVEIKMDYVRSDGTLDLNADYRPSIDYVFIRAVNAEPNDIPLGAPGYQEGDTAYELVTISINRPFRNISVTSGSHSSNYIDFGMSRSIRDLHSTATIPEAVSMPTCPIDELWNLAQDYDAPSNAVAVIEYKDNQYHFQIRDVRIDLTFDADCNLVNS